MKIFLKQSQQHKAKPNSLFWHTRDGIDVYSDLLLCRDDHHHTLLWRGLLIYHHLKQRRRRRWISDQKILQFFSLLHFYILSTPPFFLLVIIHGSFGQINYNCHHVKNGMKNQINWWVCVCVCWVVLMFQLEILLKKTLFLKMK